MWTRAPSSGNQAKGAEPSFCPTIPTALHLGVDARPLPGLRGEVHYSGDLYQHHGIQSILRYRLQVNELVANTLTVAVVTSTKYTQLKLGCCKLSRRFWLGTD